MAMRATYVESDNSTSNAQVLGTAGQDIYVKQVIFGDPTDGDTIRFYNQRVAQGHASGIGSVPDDGLTIEIVQPTGAAGKDWIRTQNFSDGGGNPGLRLDGGSFHTDGDKVTVLWEPVDEAA